jgi:hypothetical protein
VSGRLTDDMIAVGAATLGKYVHTDENLVYSFQEIAAFVYEAMAKVSAADGQQDTRHAACG